MFRQFCVVMALMVAPLVAQDAALKKGLEETYRVWRHSIQTRNHVIWQRVTARHRQVAVKNRILSEKKDFPAAVFDLPALPPDIDGLRFLGCRRSGPTAKAYYYGGIDFGLGGNPSENLLVLSFVGALDSWSFDQVEYINLAALPEVRKELAAGDIRYIDSTPELLPDGTVPVTPVEVPRAHHIAKVYVYCPGREVRVQVNQVSQHLFENTQHAELILGGARNGANEIQYAIKSLESPDPLEPMTIRVYLMSELSGVKPIKIFEYQVEKDHKPNGYGKGRFVIDDRIRARLLGRENLLAP